MHFATFIPYRLFGRRTYFQATTVSEYWYMLNISPQCPDPLYCDHHKESIVRLLQSRWMVSQWKGSSIIAHFSSQRDAIWQRADRSCTNTLLITVHRINPFVSSIIIIKQSSVRLVQTPEFHRLHELVFALLNYYTQIDLRQLCLVKSLWI